MTRCPCGPAKFSDFGVPKAKILEKIARCARQDDYNVQWPAKIGIVTLKNGENEDPAKMTYSIPDLWNRNGSV